MSIVKDVYHSISTNIRFGTGAKKWKNYPLEI